MKRKNPYSYTSSLKKRRYTYTPRYGRYITAESKFHNVDLVSTSASTHDFAINRVTEGTGANERVGRKIRSYAYEYEIFTTTSSTATLMRVVLYVPKVTTASLSTLGLADAIENDSYWVLHDKIYSTTGAGSTGLPSLCAQARVRQALTAEFTAAGGVAGGNVRMAVVFDVTTAIDGFTKTWFKDI